MIQPEIEAIGARIDKLIDEHGLDPVFSLLAQRLTRTLEKRMRNEDVPDYLASMARDGWRSIAGRNQECRA